MLKTKQPNSFLFILSTNHNSCSLFQHFIIIYEIARTLFKKRLETKTIASQTFLHLLNSHFISQIVFSQIIMKNIRNQISTLLFREN